MKRIWFLLIAVGIFADVQAQNKNTATEDYITRYRNIAIDNEKEYRIPACITLAQGIIESGSGRSTLAKESNNHFGIKCHSDWQGRRTYKDDDSKNDCFRVYDSPEESFKDHSIFLSKGRRYAFLFDLPVEDYKGWANGLKKAGYATNPKYPELLIGVIEVYDLQNVTSDNYYLVKDAVSDDVQITPADKSIKKNDVKVEDKEPVVHKKSLIERLFGNTKWYQRRHETVEQRKRREMDEKIQKMIDEKDVRRTDFEIEFE